jgi:hypothetical protein
MQNLDLRLNKKITDEGIKNITHIETLNLVENNMITDKGIKNMTLIKN